METGAKVDPLADPLKHFDSIRAITSGDKTFDQAVALTEALNAAPEVLRLLRERRQQVILALHERDGVSYTEMAPGLGVLPERVSGIARGHSRAPGGNRPAPKSRAQEATSDE